MCNITEVGASSVLRTARGFNLFACTEFAELDFDPLFRTKVLHNFVQIPDTISGHKMYQIRFCRRDSTPHHTRELTASPDA